MRIEVLPAPGHPRRTGLLGYDLKASPSTSCHVEPDGACLCIEQMIGLQIALALIRDQSFGFRNIGVEWVDHAPLRTRTFECPSPVGIILKIRILFAAEVCNRLEGQCRIFLTQYGDLDDPLEP